MPDLDLPTHPLSPAVEAALIKKFEAETRRAIAQAVYDEYNAEAMRINTEAAQRHEKVLLSANHLHHVYEFSTGVYDEPVDACLSQMAVWDRNDPNCPMHIIIDSPGGSIIAGMHLFDQISAYSKRPWDTDPKRADVPKGTHDTTITVRGYAASMAGILLQIADTRIIGPESYLMIHEASTLTHGKIGEIKDEVEFMDKISDRVCDIFVRRANPAKMNAKKFKALWDRKDVWLTSSEALDYGFVDKIG